MKSAITAISLLLSLILFSCSGEDSAVSSGEVKLRLNLTSKAAAMGLLDSVQTVKIYVEGGTEETAPVTVRSPFPEYISLEVPSDTDLRITAAGFDAGGHAPFAGTTSEPVNVAAGSSERVSIQMDYTVKIEADVLPGTDEYGPISSGPENFRELDGKLVFTATADSLENRGFFEYDGSGEASQIAVSSQDSYQFNISSNLILTDADKSTLYFTGSDSSGNLNVFTYDGSGTYETLHTFELELDAPYFGSMFLNGSSLITFITYRNVTNSAYYSIPYIVDTESGTSEQAVDSSSNPAALTTYGVDSGPFNFNGLSVFSYYDSYSYTYRVMYISADGIMNELSIPDGYSINNSTLVAFNDEIILRLFDTTTESYELSRIVQSGSDLSAEPLSVQPSVEGMSQINIRDIIQCGEYLLVSADVTMQQSAYSETQLFRYNSGLTAVVQAPLDDMTLNFGESSIENSCPENGERLFLTLSRILATQDTEIYVAAYDPAENTVDILATYAGTSGAYYDVYINSTLSAGSNYFLNLYIYSSSETGGSEIASGDYAFIYSPESGGEMHELPYNLSFYHTIMIGNTLYFAHEDSDTGEELWSMKYYE